MISKAQNRDAMKNHMNSLKEKNIYMCDIVDCYYECGTVNKLNDHKRSWSDVANSPPKNIQAHNRHIKGQKH